MIISHQRNCEGRFAIKTTETELFLNREGVDGALRMGRYFGVPFISFRWAGEAYDPTAEQGDEMSRWTAQTVSAFGVDSALRFWYKESNHREKGDINMNLIPSFSVDHTRIIPGIFTSRVDTLGDQTVTTYDVRVTRPNVEPMVDVAAMHSLEHIIATFLRNEPDWKDQIIYWGPMGCLTGFYLIMKGDHAPQELCDLLCRAFRSVAQTEEVPGASAVNCGTYRMHNLEMAKWHAARFAAYLAENAENPAIFEYPRSERLVTEDGRQFFDS